VKPLRVLFVTPYYKPYLGGIERSIEQLAARLRLRGHVVGVLTTSYEFPHRYRPGLARRETIDDGVEVFRLPSWPRRALPSFSVPLVWFPPRAIAGVLETFEPDVIHWVGDGWFWAHFWTWYFGRRSGALVFTPSFHSLRPAYRWLQPINALLTRAVDRIAVLSAIEHRAIRRTYLAPETRIREVGWGVSAPSPGDLPPRGWRSDRLTVLCVGRLGEHKGQDWLLDRFVTVLPRLARPARLILVGRDEGGMAMLSERVRREGLADDVLLAGEVDDAELRRWYAHADLFALFSRYEAFGLVYLEAMAFGLPVLTHAVGATAEVAHRGAVVVAAFDAPAAEAALGRLLADDAYRHPLGEEAAAHAAEHSWDSVAARYLDLYQAARRRRALPTPSAWLPAAGAADPRAAQSGADSGADRALDHVHDQGAPAVVPRAEPFGRERVVVLAEAGALDQRAAGVDQRGVELPEAVGPQALGDQPVAVDPGRTPPDEAASVAGHEGWLTLRD
jgi:glycosyltransferase involved in cell wall biosynthesis